ncbi:MAG: hypothetical protein OJF58_005226 [Enhydrobacter sp.]|nr:MAG: hypothetical protein OJF58_005226 [Enhydrobacter sp.]
MSYRLAEERRVIPSAARDLFRRRKDLPAFGLGTTPHGVVMSSAA